MAPTDTALPFRVSDLWVHYDGAEAVRGISFSVEPGEVVALVGANGAGKTTVLRAITGLHPATSGTIRYGDLDLARLKAHQIVQQGIAHVPEGRRLFYRMTVRENLQIGMYQRWSSGATGIDRAFELFPDLEPFVDRRCFMLSGGQQQMVAVARALLPEPNLLLLDRAIARSRSVHRAFDPRCDREDARPGYVDRPGRAGHLDCTRDERSSARRRKRRRRRGGLR
ncbi:MAG: ATP-binding cassette domain-containing protein [Acidimicrobiales bacterium]|nr:ATP-binding cassette domain-containing protein [Acidimicrobiales bacterium]